MRRREFVASLTALSVGGAAVGAASGGALQQGGQLGELQFDSTCSLLNADQQPLTDDALVAVWGEPTATNGDEDGNGDAVSYPSETPIPLVAVDSGVVGVGAPLVADGDDNFGAGNEEFLLNVWDDQLGSGKVLWDESHGQYYDLSRFGQFETYAESNGYDVQATAEYAVEGSSDLVNALDTAAPAGVVITSPSEGFTDAEQSRLATYVENGGTLLVHSQSDFNDFDATANLDDLASTLGVGFRFNDDQVFDTANNGGADYVPVTSNFNTTFPFFEDRDGISTQLDLQKGESYEVTVTSVADGDTVDVEFPSGPVESVRVLGIDTPETASSASAERPEEWEGLGRRAPVFGPLTFGSTSSLLAPDRSTLTDDSVVAVRAAASATNEDADGNGDAVTYPSETPIPLAASDGRVAGLGAMLVDDDSGDRTFGSANEEFVLNVWDQLVGPGSTVTFDDGHGQFYSSDKFGDFTAYAEENGYTVEATTDLTSVLVETDAIVITSPAEAFSDEELTALSTFVDDGGALLCHDQSDYNDFDATDNINAVAEAVGAPFRFNDDQVVDADSNAGQPFLPQTTGFNTTTFAYFGDRSGLGSDDTAPEPNYPTLSSYAAEASTFAADRLADATVTLSFDQNEPIRDPFGRLLAYVEYDAGGETTLYNRAVVDAGLARVYDSTLERHDEFLVAENSARTEGRGLWADSDTSATPPIRNRPVDGLFFPKPTSVVTESGPLASEASVVTTESTARQVEESVTYEGDIPVAGIDTDGRVAVVGAPIVDEGYEVAEGFDVDTSGYENYTFLSNLLETMSERDGAVVVDGGHGQFAEDWALSAEDAAYYQRYLEGFEIEFEQRNAITAEALEGASGLIVSTPAEEFTADERDAVTAFRDDGGAVVLLGSGVAPAGARANLNDLAAALETDLRVNDGQLRDAEHNLAGDEMLPTTTAFDGPASLFEPFDPDADESGAGTTDEPTVSVTVPDGPIVTDAETTATLTLSDAPDGLSGYRISLSVEDAAIARVEGAAYPEALQDGLTKSPEQDTSSATLEALDIDDAIGAGATDVELGSVKLVGEAPGEVTLTAEVHDLDDDTGTALDPATSDGALTVSPLSPIGDNERLPGDLDGDGRYEDVDGDGQASYNDVVELFEHRREPAVADNPSAFDFNENGRLDYDDIVALFEEI